MLATLLDLYLHDPDWHQFNTRLKSATRLSTVVLIAWQIGLWMARALVTQQVSDRAQAPTRWGVCPQCGQRLRSKGLVSRQLLTLVGPIRFRRRIGRCPRGCHGSQRAPFDASLGLSPYQQTSDEVQRLGCLLAVLLPYELASWLLAQMSGLQVSNDTLWQWVQAHGKQAWQVLKTQLYQATQGHFPASESMSQEMTELPLLISADGVKIPFRPMPGTPKGKIRWREVKVAILARLGHRFTRAGKRITQLYHRRVVAVLDDIHQFQAHLTLETHRQAITHATQVIWISDGAPGFWGIFERCFAQIATGILDFYHAASHLWTSCSGLSRW